MTIKEAQEAVDQWIKEYGVRYFSELTNMACLTEEVGELARVIARTYGDQSFKKGEKGQISVTYNGKGMFPGHFKKSITVRSNGNVEMSRLYIEGVMTEKK